LLFVVIGRPGDGRLAKLLFCLWGVVKLNDHQQSPYMIVLRKMWFIVTIFRSLDDLDTVKSLSNGKVDLTIGSALDTFGGSGVTLEHCVNWNERNN